MAHLRALLSQTWPFGQFGFDGADSSPDARAWPDSNASIVQAVKNSVIRLPREGVRRVFMVVMLRSDQVKERTAAIDERWLLQIYTLVNPSGIPLRRASEMLRKGGLLTVSNREHLSRKIYSSCSGAVPDCARM
jgi:hypothetical protein